MLQYKNLSTIRKCNRCSYQTFILNDNLNFKECKCNGNLEIIAKSKGD